jgi:hypothetical protein
MMLAVPGLLKLTHAYVQHLTWVSADPSGGIATSS